MVFAPKDRALLVRAHALVEAEYEATTEKRERTRKALNDLEEQQTRLSRAMYGLRKLIEPESDC